MQCFRLETERLATMKSDMPVSSPFSKTNLIPIEVGYSTEGLITGLRLPDGQIILNFDKNTNLAVLKAIATITQSEIVNVKGTWTFTPHVEGGEDDE